MDAPSAPHGWAGSSEQLGTKVGLADVSRARFWEPTADVPKAVLDAFAREVWTRVYKPVFDADNADRWDVLQKALFSMGEVFTKAPFKRDSSRRTTVEQDREAIANAVAKNFDDLHQSIDEGLAYTERRAKIFRRRARDIDALLADINARRSFTAASGFVWALACFAIAPVVHDISVALENPDLYKFTSSVLHHGGRDQYLLLRAAELALSHAEELRSSIEAGEMTDEARTKEEETHAYWLEPCQQLASDP